MIVQGSPEWFAARLGKVTASKVSDVVAKTKSGWGASRANYMAALIAERSPRRLPTVSVTRLCSGELNRNRWPVSPMSSSPGATLSRLALSITRLYPMTGASPDGFVGEDGLVEIKCPNTATHIDTLLDGKVPGSTSFRCSGRWPAQDASGATS